MGIIKIMKKVLRRLEARATSVQEIVVTEHLRTEIFEPEVALRQYHIGEARKVNRS
jgi:hypothetical protein